MFNQTLTYTKQPNNFRYVATVAHGQQMYGFIPYAAHLATVEGILVEHGYDSYHYRAAAWLHDVLEDTDISANFLYLTFGEVVFQMIDACTGLGDNRKTRNARIYYCLKQCPEAVPVKVADRISHLVFGTATNGKKLKMYVDEHAEFLAVVKPTLLETKQGVRLLATLEEAYEKAKELAVVSENRIA